MYLICLLILILTQIVSATKNGIEIPLVRQKSMRESAMNVRHVKVFDAYWKKPNNSTNDTLAIYRYLDSEFYAVIQIGKKARPFNLLIDTAWGDSWVMSEDCSYYTVGCWFHNKYDHSKSSSYYENGTNFNVNEGFYNLTGYYSKDIFHLEKLNVINQTFVEMTNVPPIYAINKADGVLGLGYASLSQAGVTPVFYNLFKQGRIKKSLFSIYLNRDRSSHKGGTLYLGRIEDRHVKNRTITYLPVIQTGYWQFQMDRIQFEISNKTYGFCLYSCYAYADTSSNTISGPDLEIKKINRLIGAKYIYIYNYGRYQVDCDTVNTLPHITFMIKGKEFTIEGRDYIQHLSYKSFTFCLSAFTSSRVSNNLWSLGGAFLSQYYSIYNLDTNVIGFVRSESSDENLILLLLFINNIMNIVALIKQ